MWRVILWSIAFSNFLRIDGKNIILIIADDLDLVLDGMTPLQNTRSIIGNHGMTFTNCFVASPICCPNRASILTGRYQHNHFTFNNSINGGCSNSQWQNTLEKQTFASILKNRANYKTFYAGKYLNQYGTREAGGAQHIPSGWDWWAGLIGNSKYYNYSLSINGTAKKYGDDPRHYLTDIVRQKAVDFIEGLGSDSETPFLMVLSPPAPHAPFTPAVRHTGYYINTKAPRDINFNTRSQDGKHWLVRTGLSPLPDRILPELDFVYQKRWETLLAVDDLVVNVYRALDKSKLLNDTYIIFTSDNGYHIGQFSMPLDKRQPYETDIKVPLLIRGPGITPSVVSAPVSSVDLFATILDIAGVEEPSDGISVLMKNIFLDRTLLIEYKGEHSNVPSHSGCPSDQDLNLSLCSKNYACKCEDAANNTYACVRRVSEKYNNIFCIFEDNQNFIEAYDLKNDQYQMNNIGYSMKRAIRYRFRKRLKSMLTCRGAECVRAAPRPRAEFF